MLFLMVFGGGLLTNSMAENDARFKDTIMFYVPAKGNDGGFGISGLMCFIPKEKSDPIFKDNEGSK